MTRKPAVAGTFYRAGAGSLNEQVASFIPADIKRRKVKALMSPHAGLMYSGAVAGSVYASIEPPATFVLLGPNHTGLGNPVAMMPEGQWEIPTANVQIDSALAHAIAARTGIVTQDSEAHAHEHSLEVQLPFIASVAPQAKIVPITIMQAAPDELIALGEAIADAVMAVEYPVVIAASSDMSHFISHERAMELDRLAIDRVLELDPAGLLSVVRNEGISMCGVLPAVAMLAAAKKLGAKQATLTGYATSGEVSGDMDSVVGYAGVIIY